MSLTPDHPPAPTTSPEYSDEERNVFSIDQLDQWRAFQKDDLKDRRSRDSSTPALGVTLAPGAEPAYVTEFKNGIDDSLDRYLESQGLPVDSPNRDEVKALFREASIDKIHEDEWTMSPAVRGVDPDDDTSKRDIFSEKIADRLRAAGTTAPDPDDEETERLERERRINEARVAVNEARERWATVSSKRQGKVLGRNAKDQAPAYHDYNDKVNQLGRLELETVISDDSVSEEDKNVAVIDYLFAEQAKLRELTTEKLKNTKISKFIGWMNKGGFAKRVLKGMALGAVAGGVGAFAAGAVGAGVVAAGAVGVSRFIRGFALGDRDKRGMATVDDSIDRGDIASRMADMDDGDAFDKASTHFNSAFENDTRKEQNKRRRAAITGLGMVAVGSAAGYGLHAAAEVISHHGLQLWHPGLGGHDAAKHAADLPKGSGNQTLPQSGEFYVPPSPTTVNLPGSEGFAYPWNWAHAAAPKGVNPETWLHSLGDKAAAAGHNVEWHKGAGDIEWVSVDGKSGTADVIKIFRQVAQ